MSKFTDAVKSSIRKGITERAPIQGEEYHAFVVQPLLPGNLFGMAIAHCDGSKFVIDLVREDISVEDAAVIVKQYGAQLNGAVGDKDDALAHAVAGVIHELQRELQ